MKKVTLVLLLSLVPVFTIAAAQQEKQYSLELSEPEKTMRLNVELRNGNVIVEGYQGRTVEIMAKINPLSESELKEVGSHRREKPHINQKVKKSREKSGLKSINNISHSLEIQEYNNRVSINSERSSNQIDLIVKVPMSAQVEVSIYRGNEVRVNNIKGPIEIETWKGDIYANNISGPIVAETHQYAIEVVFSEFSDKSPSSLTTYGGDIDVTMPKKAAAKINVQNYQGEILSGLDSEFVATETIKRNKKGSKQEIIVGGQMTADINGGGQHITLTTYSGDILLRKP